MPTITEVITTKSNNVSMDTIKTLHTELTAVGLPVVGTEGSDATKFGPATSDELKLFQDRYQLPVTGNLDPATGGVLSLSALVATEPDRAKLRTELANMVNNVPDSPEYNYWLARYSIMAGDYALAKKVGPGLVDLSGKDIDLGNILPSGGGTGPGSPQQPDIPFPENFYSYRYDLMSQDDIDQLRSTNQFLGTMPFMARASRQDGSPGEQPPPAPPPPGVSDPPPTTAPGMSRQERLAASAIAFLNAIEAWQLGNAEFSRERYASAVQAHDHCQQAILDYFSIFPDYSLQFTTNTLSERVDELVWHLASDRQTWSDVWTQINWRRQLLSLAELGQFDWTPITGGRYASIVYQLLEANLAGNDQPPTNAITPQDRKIFVDTHLLVIAAVLVPLARGEANRLRRQYSLAKEDFSRALRNSVPVPNSASLFAPALLRCEFIETPFARLLLIETMLDEAEAQYKARQSVDDESDDTTRTQEVERIGELTQDFADSQIPGDPTLGAQPFQHLVAALTYADAMNTIQDDGEYVARTKNAVKTLTDNVISTVDGGDVTSMAFQALGNEVTIPTVSAAGDSLPGLTSGTNPHEPYLQFNSPDGQPMRECNPRVYGLLLQAQARLLQIWSRFNYLGYRDDYVPPWRFQYLLDRARYFAEHAKNAQRDYLNFLNNAENEEFKEMSAAQNVELEKANVQIETARVDQAAKEVTASKESVMQAQVNIDDAQQRLENYQDFNTHMDELNSVSAWGSLESIGLGIAEIATGVGAGQGVQSIQSGVNGLVSAGKEELQRYLEESNLKLAVGEANQAGKVALAQLDVAKAGLVVAGLQRQAALLRHEFALQNLQFIRNQTLNTEQWYRLAGAIRSVSDTYLRYAISIAFQAQQAYNFELDKRLNVIRFDYDLSDVGAMLAADFLLRDLDSLEQDLIVSQQTRILEVRYVLSMAREFPETLRALADTGKVMFNMRLEQLERHFPGLLNLRISSVDVQPAALMDPTRVSMELKQTGVGTVRLKAQPGVSPLNNSDLAAEDDWLAAQDGNWPVKIHVSSAETAVFTGLSRQETTGLSLTAASERGAFEGLPAASSWSIDMSMKENEVIPGYVVRCPRYLCVVRLSRCRTKGRGHGRGLIFATISDN